jgi:putative hydrolase of the HAD superfamily
MAAEHNSPRRAVFLDALGTLVSLSEPWPALVTALREQHGVDVSLREARRALLVEMGYYRRECRRAGNAATLAELRLECASIVRDELAPALEHLSAAELVPTLLGALRFEAFPDARPALERWRDAGLVRVVVSNWDTSLHDVLRNTGLADLLDGVVTSAEVGHAKPDPRIFERALELAGVAASEATHIGDSPEEDIAGARAAGITAILLRRTSDGAQAPADGPAHLASLREW